MTTKGDDQWMRVQSRLRAEVGEEIFSSWFARMTLEAMDNGSVHLSVPTRFLRSWVQNHYGARLLSCWQAENDQVRRIELTVRSAAVRQPSPAVQRPAPTELPAKAPGRGQGIAPVGESGLAGPQDILGSTSLDPRLTFDHFIVGRCNELAHAAARQIATAPRGDIVMFNPLYIHAGVGLGKTHLLQAIAWAGNQRGDRKMVYLTAERFVYSFVAALRSQTAIAFKETLRSIDVLIIDDLQFLQGKSTQAEFSHTLNSMIDAGRQVVVAGDRPPSDMESFDDRMRSRLAGGLVVELGALSEDLRLDILRSRIELARAHHPVFNVPPAVTSFIANSVTQNGRDLEGAVSRLLARSKLTDQPITLELAERELRDLIKPQEPRRVKIEDIQRVVAQYFNVSRSDLLSSRRTANVVRPRQIAMYLAKTMTLRSLPEIGRRFGGRDHTTVLHAVRKIEQMVTKDTLFANEIESLKRRLQE